MGEIIDHPGLRDRRFVFLDRHDAGDQLGAFLRSRPDIQRPVVCAIPNGGVPVGIGIARALGAPLTLAIVRKIQIPCNTEAGFGAVTWDGRVLLNDRLVALLGLSDADVRAAIALTQKNVKERIVRYAGGQTFPDLAGRCAILTDDGLASGFTMLAAITSIRARNPARVIVAVPTASTSSAALVAKEADELVCLNIRKGFRFAVAEAYERWYDLTDEEVLAGLSGLQEPGSPEK